MIEFMIHELLNFHHVLFFGPCHTPFLQWRRVGSSWHFERFVRKTWSPRMWWMSFCWSQFWESHISSLVVEQACWEPVPGLVPLRVIPTLWGGLYASFLKWHYFGGHTSQDCFQLQVLNFGVWMGFVCQAQLDCTQRYCICKNAMQQGDWPETFSSRHDWVVLFWLIGFRDVVYNPKVSVLHKVSWVLMNFQSHELLRWCRPL